jgi:thioredoxin reductase
MKHYELIIAGGGPAANSAILATVVFLKQGETVHAMDR